MQLVHAARASGVILISLLCITSMPLHAQSFACVAGSTPTDTSASTFLQGLTKSVQGAWTNVGKSIDPLAAPPGSGDQVTACPSNGGTACFAHLGLTNCEHVSTSYSALNYAGLSNVSITSFDVGTFNPKDVATHSAWGPDAGKVSDGVFAPEGETWNSPYFTVILPTAGENSAVTLDLGSSLTICGTSACGPFVQADRHNMELDWWDDTDQVWKVWGGTCESSGSGLISRRVIPSATPASVKCGATTSGSNFTTRYVRLWALTGANDSNFSVSEIQLKDGTGKVVSTGKIAVGPRPYLINDNVWAKAGTSWNDPTYAVVLRASGAGSALAIDLGGRINLCVSGTCIPSIQADKNVYQVDYSLDGTSWVSYGQLPAVSATGLQTRSVVPTGATAKYGPTGVTARYVRIWGCDPSQCPDSGDTNFSVSEMALNNTSGVNVAVSANTTFGPAAFGPEPVATNGVPPADSANLNWNDPRYTTILSPCLPNAAQKCAILGSTLPTTGPLFVDLTGKFSISGIEFQGDRHQFQVDYFDDSTGSWQALGQPIAMSASSGLSTRAVQLSATIQARYLMVYGTAGDDNNYSVSSLKVFTPMANTACGYASAANYGQNFGCSYDAALATQVGPSSGLSISFTIGSASSHLRCTNGTTTANWTALDYPAGTTCTATLVPKPLAGGYCSGYCPSTGFVATLAGIGPPLPPPSFVLTGFTCSNPVTTHDSSISQSAISNFSNGLIEYATLIAQGTVAQAVNGTVVNPQLAYHVPSGACAATLETPNTKLAGSATQVGSSKDNGHVRLSGEAYIPASTRLDAVALTLQQVLFEAGGVEELVRSDGRGDFVPRQLQLQPGSKPTRAVYATAPSRVPSVRAVLSRTHAGSMAFDIQIDRARMPTLPRCTGVSPAAELATRFTLDDAGNSITVRARQSWACQGKQLRTL